MNIEDIRNLITQSQNEIDHLNDVRRQLEEARSTMTEEEYNRELADINSHLETEQERLEENQRINRHYNNVLTNLNAINDIRNIEPRDDEEREEIEREITARQEEIQRVSGNLPEELLAQARSEVLQRNTTNQTQASQPTTTPSVSEPTQEQAETTKLEALQRQIQTSQQEILHLNEVMRQLQLARNLLSEEEYERERQNITNYIERATNQLREQNTTITAYNNMLDNIRKLNVLSEVVPRDSQDEDQIAEEKERREEEIKRARAILPEEYQQEIRDIILKEEEEKRKNRANPNVDESTKKTAKEPNKTDNPVQPTTPEKEPPALPSGTEKKQPALPPGTEKKQPALPPSKEDEPTPEPKKRVRTLEEILDYVKRNKDGKPLRIKGKTGKRLKAANIQVTKSFSEELHSGNWLYNVVHVAPAVVGLAIKGAKKLIAKFNLWRTEQQDVEKEIRDRINELSEEELDVVRREYRGQRVIEDLKTPSVVKDLLREKIAVEDTRKTVAGINQRISANYQTLLATFNGVQAIDKQLADKSLSAEKREALTAQRAALLKGKADLVHETRELYIQGNDELSGGAHGFSEDVKASESKMNLQGKRFAKVPDYDETTAELQEALAKLSRREKDACETHDDEAALRAFVETETLKSKETEISNSILGKRSTGRMYYSPLVGELDYRDDPFIRDLFSTVALVGAGVSAANAIRTHVTETPKVVDEHNAQVEAVNAHNQDTMSQVHQAGQGIYDKADVFRKGQEAQAQQDVVNFGNTGERMSLDSSAIEAGGDWGHGLGTSFYRNADDAQHAMTESIYNETQARISDIGSRYATGELDQLAALQEVGKVAADSQQTLTNLVDQYRPVLEQYASTHPQFELGAMQSGLEFISQNPTAIIDMNQAMVDTVQMGQSLTGLTVEEVQALQNLPSDLQTTLIGAATAAGLAFKTASTMDQRYAKRTGYGNDLTDMVEDFVAEQEEKETVRSK